jgi:predicted O-methyltransferase YrrM
MEFENLIYKKSNLEQNDSISTYNGWAAQQNPHCFEIFYNFLKKNKPKRILEIGTALGGFTYFLKHSCKRLQLDCEILSFDIHGRHYYEEMIKYGIDVRVENIFDEKYEKLNQEIINFIKLDGLTLVLCDGGNKIGEFNLISKFLKKGDIIMAHDYAYDRETFDKKINLKLWNWFEISEKDIQDACITNNLVDIDRDLFEKAVWVSKIKI